MFIDVSEVLAASIIRVLMMNATLATFVLAAVRTSNLTY
jgi:hypothetical protein